MITAKELNDEIYRLCPSNISKHCGDHSKMNVLDISPTNGGITNLRGMSDALKKIQELIVFYHHIQKPMILLYILRSITIYNIMKAKIKILLFISLIFCVLISCNKKSVGKNESLSIKDTFVKKEKLKDTITDKKIVNVELEKKNANNLKMLSGIWGEEGENASWIINGDTLQYFEDIENGNIEYHKIDYKNGVITILYGENDTLTQYKILKLTTDSLIIQTEAGIIIKMIKFI